MSKAERFGNPCAGGQCKIPGVGCFVAGTAVAAITGTVAIETVKVGDLVLAKDPETGITGYYTVTSAFSRTVPTIVELEPGADLITTTPEHPFRVQDRGRVPAEEGRTAISSFLCGFSASLYGRPRARPAGG